MNLSELTKEELDAAFKQASANGESLTPFIEETKKRINPSTNHKESDKIANMMPDDGADGDNVCIACQ